MNKNKFLILVILFLLPISIIGFLVKTKLYQSLTENNITITKYNLETENKQLEQLESNINIKVNVNEKITEMNLEEYIVGVLAGEMPASFELEALKAQAVAARTYAMYKINNASGDYDVIDTIDDQVYLTIEEMQEKWGSNYDEYYKKIYTAVSTTQNQVLMQNDEIIKAFFFSMSNGYTENSITVFKEGNLEGVESKWDNENLNNFEVTTEFTTNELKDKLSITEESVTLKILTRSETNRVTQIQVNDKIYTGIEFRKLLTLRSTDFTLEQTSAGYNITTKGNGHGVGMSQYGANGMAEEGYTYDEILKYYYQSTELKTL